VRTTGQATDQAGTDGQCSPSATARRMCEKMQPAGPGQDEPTGKLYDSMDDLLADSTTTGEVPLSVIGEGGGGFGEQFGGLLRGEGRLAEALV
jgi:hypothetical protein